MASDDEQLNHLLENGLVQDGAPRKARGLPAPEAQAPGTFGIEFRQWQVGMNDSFRPAAHTKKILPPGIYSFREDQFGIYVQKMRVVTDSITPLPDSANERILKGMEIFWTKRDNYKEHGLLYKRGILLWGPPGSGKTATLQQLSQNLLDLGGIVILCENPHLAAQGLAALRRIEPNRPLICVLEDIDELIRRWDEHQILALLDGENQVDNIVNIATTNYPERLGARIVNRPSRFDERILVGMPSTLARRAYLEHVAPKLQPSQLQLWTEETKGLSIAHLRELAAAVLCLGQPYDEVISRLKTMRQPIKERDGEPNMGKPGFLP